MSEKKVLVIGSGIAGLCAAIKLARFGISVELLEKAREPGGHARQFACKATDKCAKCGACIVEEKIEYVASHPRIRLYTGISLDHVKKTEHFSIGFTDRSGAQNVLVTDAIVIASGFRAFNPEKKPYGYGLFDNVMTNLELEHMLRRESMVKRPSDNKIPGKLAFIQCVGSRDEKLHHLWCSKVCCGSALRMARVIKSKSPELEITFFYMDVQRFGKNFQTVFTEIQRDIKLIRAIPGDIYRTENDQLKVNYFCAGDNVATEELFDMVVLSVGITPGEDNQALAELLNAGLESSGFFCDSGNGGEKEKPAIFFAGTAKGPMGIADAMADAGRVAWEIVKFLG